MRYCNTEIKKPETFNIDSSQKWDDEELHNIVDYIHKAKKEFNEKGTHHSLKTALTYLDEMNQAIEPRLMEELKKDLKPPK